MLEHSSGFPRGGSLLQALEADSSGPNRTSNPAGEPDVFSRRRSRTRAPDPSKLAAVEAELLEGEHADVVAVHRTPPRPGEHGEWPHPLDPRLAAALAARGIDRPYRHQADALAALAGGGDVVLATATASGKSLAFQVPIIEAVLADRRARALMLFPTKALARDQVRGLRELGDGLCGVGVYDGDTPPDERRAARSRAHAVATNPDMLHRGLLPHHDRWGAFLANLRYVVIDEIHAYRGVFGSHVANVLRRLWRVCGYHGARPQIIACSATIANPRELAEGLCGRPGFHLVDQDTSPAGPRTFVVLSPKVVDEVTGVRRDYLKVTRAVTSVFRRAGVSTLAFCRTRKAVELLTRYMREDEVGWTPEGPTPIDSAAWARAERSIRGYRGGYLPERRREVERALQAGEARLVAATNALELGVDIGGLDAVVLAGYPGTRAATIQRSGRAGRRSAPSLTAMVLTSDPLDQFVGADPGFLFDTPPEHARLDADNPEILIPHLRCAAHELPISADESIAGIEPADLLPALDYLGERGVLRREEDPDGRILYFAIGDAFPADKVDLRSSIEENFAVVELAPGTADDGRILAEVDFEDGPLYLHPGAIYPIEGRTYEVLRLDWDARKAYVREVRSTYYTEAVTQVRVRVVDPIAVDEAAGHGVGYAHLVRTVPGFKKLRFGSHENIGFGPVGLPDLELHTVAAFWSLPASVLAHLTDPGRRAAAALAVAHAIHHCAALVLMCDVHDLGHAVTASAEPGQLGAWAHVIEARRGKVESDAWLHASAIPSIHLYDNMPGGAGLATQAYALGVDLFERILRVIEGCRCRQGCPTCLGAQAVDPLRDAPTSLRSDAIELLHALREAVG
ncbi:MAG: DEAD/DEAH box helicase [Myxococcales bacterium]|nr:DEAD/DEAH box helicase [Myxococcales bacterium]